VGEEIILSVIFAKTAEGNFSQKDKILLIYGKPMQKENKLKNK
jgi:hypothetical protein